MARETIEVQKRVVYGILSGKRRKRTVYDSEGKTEDGLEWCVQGASSAAACRAQARADIAYMRANPACAALGFQLAPYAVESWCMRFPSGGSCMHSAKDLEAARAYWRAAWTREERPDLHAFLDATEGAGSQLESSAKSEASNG